MKKILAIALTIAALMTWSLALAESVNGTFEGTAQGFGGEITVQVTLTDGVITEMTAEGPNETEGIGAVAVEKLPDDIVAANSINVDAYSGATFSSAGIVEATKAALESAGLNPDDYMTKAEAVKAEDAVYETDIVVVGAGGAGMTAAITAADAGRKVIIVESQNVVGGNSVKSTGGMNAAKTVYQDENTFAETSGVEKTLESAAATYADNETISALAAKVTEQWEAYQANPEGYFDSVELMELDTLIGGKAVNDPKLVEVLCSNSAAAIDWLKTINIDLVNVGAFGGASVKRIHRPVNDEGKVLSVGAYIVPRFEAAAQERENITFLLETTANKILVEDGAAVGIEAVGKTGEKVTINAKAVILASGGFGANLDMVASYNPALAGFMTTNAPGILGEGIIMAEEAGAALVDMDQIQIHPTVQFDSSALITEGLRGDGAILVNADGKRFIDEVGTRDVVSAAEIAQPGSFSWLIVDQKMVDASTVIQGYITKGFTFEGDTYEALAEAIAVDPAVFAETMNDWNAKVAAKEDPDFGRTSFAEPLDSAPFYAIKVTAGIHHTMGGVKINENTEVLDTNDNVIKGLFAAGEVTGGVHGANRLGGTAVADIVVFGRIAGENAAEYTK